MPDSLDDCKADAADDIAAAWAAAALLAARDIRCSWREPPDMLTGGISSLGGKPPGRPGNPGIPPGGPPPGN